MKKHFTPMHRLPALPTINYWWRHFNALLFITLTFSLTAFAQNKIWDKTIGGSRNDELTSFQQTSDGGYILGGSSESGKSGDKSKRRYGAYGTDYWIVKLNADRSKAWDKTIGGDNREFLSVVQPTSDGGYILGGSSASEISGDKSEASKGSYDYWVVKLDARGNKVWDKTFGGNKRESLTAVEQTSDGGYILGGSSESGIGGDKTEASRGYEDYWIVKLNPDGSKAWDKTFGGNVSDELASLQQTKDGGYILGGSSSSGKSSDKSQGSKGYNDYWLVKLNANGTKAWDKTLGGDSFDRLASMQQTSDGGYILGGNSASSSSGDKSEPRREPFFNENDPPFDYWVVKVDANGRKQWDKTIGGKNPDELNSLQIVSDGGYVLGGSSYSNASFEKTERNQGSADYWIVKIKADGSKVWDKTLGTEGTDWLTAQQQTNDGGFILGGSSYSGMGGDKSEASKGGNDYWVVKLDSTINYKKEQTITFQPIPNQDYPLAKTILLTASSTSGLPVSFSIVSGPATIKNNQLTVTGTGTVTVKASQAGNATYDVARIVVLSFEVINSSLTQLWNRTYGGVVTEEVGYSPGTPCDGFSGRSSFSAMVATPDGGYLLGGTSDSKKGNDKSEDHRGTASGDECLAEQQPITDYWIVKTDANGRKLWDKTFGGNHRDELTALIATPGGGYLLGGNSQSGNSDNWSEIWLVKIDAKGNKLWDKTLGRENGNNYLQAMVTTPDGGYLIGNWIYNIIKLDADGKEVWEKSFFTAPFEDLTSLIATPDGGYLLGGIDNGEDATNGRESQNYRVTKLDTNGNKLWEKIFGSNKYDYLKALVATPDGGYLLGGYSDGGISGEKSEANKGKANRYGNFREDYWVIKIDANGNKVWDKTLGGSDGERLTALVATPDGGYLLGGNSDSGRSGDKSEAARGRIYEDYWVVKLDASGQKIWDKTYGGSGYDNLKVLLTTTNDDYLLGGTSGSSIGKDKWEDRKGLEDFWVVKVKETAPEATAWNMRYGGAGHDNFTNAIKTSDGGYLTGGSSVSGSSGDKSQLSQGQNDYWIVKTDKNGQKLWDKRYGGSRNDYLNRIIQTQDGGYLLGGTSLSNISGDKTQISQGGRDYWVVKVDKQGNKQWDKTFGGSGYDELKKVIQLASGEYVLGGYSDSPVSGDKTQSSRGGIDYWLVKISADGTKLWDKRYGGKLGEILGSFTETRDGGFLLGGTSLSGQSGDKSQPSYGAADFWAVKTDKDGNLLWEKTLGGSGQEEAYSVRRSNGDNLYLAGTSESAISGDKSQGNQGGKDYWLIKLDEQGTKLWDRTFGGSKDDELRASTFTDEGYYFLAGYSYSDVSGDKTQASQGGSDYWVVQVDAEGNKIADQRYGGSGQDELRTVFQTHEGGLLLGGRSDSNVSGDRTQPSQGGTDYWLVKVAPLTSALAAAREATPVEAAVSQESVALQAFPNPFADRATIRFTLPQTQPVQVKVYDGQGREITTLFQGQAQANQAYEVEWQAGKKAAGMYLLQLQTPTKRQQQKLLLTK